MTSEEFVFTYNGQTYPSILKRWGMARYITPLALQFCKGKGIDVGAGEDPLPGAVAVDVLKEDGNDAFNLSAQDAELDYIFSSHCLEHLDDFVGALEYWISKLKPGGVLFLYLPSWKCAYWRPWNNRKHRHQFEPHHIDDCLKTLGLEHVMVSGVDLAHSFSAVGFKAKPS